MRVDILVNNAATVEPLGPTAGIKAGDLRLAFEVNVIAPAALTGAVLPGMLEAGWGRVVNVSSGIAASLLAGDDTGAIWDVGTAPAGA